MLNPRPFLPLSIALTAGLALAAARAGEETTWQSVKTTGQVLREIDQILTPGLFNQSRVALIAFPADGTTIELPLPHEGTDASGKPRPALKGALRQNAIWLDLDGDGKIGSRERSAIPQVGTSMAFSCPSYGADGSSESYTFKLQATKKTGEFRIIRCCARIARVGQGHTLVLIDDNGNGLYNDIGQDALLIDQQPVTFLGRQLYLGSELYDVRVQPGGATIEIRPAAHCTVGMVNLFRSYTYPQKAGNLRIHTVIVQGAENAFSFNPQLPSRPLPTGTYNMTFALFERSSERIYMLKGNTTSITVVPDQESSPTWGAPIQCRFDVNHDGRTITLSPPALYGAAGESYLPADLQKITCYGTVAPQGYDRNNEPFSGRTQKFINEPNGEIKPLVFEQRTSGLLDILVDYKSGILGSVQSRQSIDFVSNR